MMASTHHHTLHTAHAERPAPRMGEWLLSVLVGAVLTLALCLLLTLFNSLTAGYFAIFVVTFSVTFVPLALLTSLAAWLIPATKANAGLWGPLLAWFLSMFVPGFFQFSQETYVYSVDPSVLIATGVPALLMVLCWWLFRTARRRRAA